VKRLDLDLQQEALLLQPSLVKMISLVPHAPHECERAKLKTKDGKVYEIPIL
jgi:hypothetical protein